MDREELAQLVESRIAFFKANPEEAIQEVPELVERRKLWEVMEDAN